MKPSDLVERLKLLFPDGLQSVILYGSAVSGDFLEKRSDYNVLIVLDTLGLAELKALSKPTRDWVKAGNPPPRCFTVEHLKRSVDVFPLELLDIKENRRVLYGADVVEGLQIREQHLRHELEYELKSKLLQLEGQYLLTGGHAKEVVELMVNTLSTFLVLFRGTLRLFESIVPAAKLEALRALSARLDIPIGAFETIHEIKTGRRSAKDVDVDELFKRYLSEIEAVVERVDRHLHSASDTKEQSHE